MRESDYPNVHRRWVAVMVILLLSCLLVSVSVCESADVELGYTSGIWVAADITVSGLDTNEIRGGTSAGSERSGYSVDGIGDKIYTLKILGFTDSWPGGTPVDDFITQEEKNNHAYLIGTLSSVLKPKPQINITKETSDDNTTWHDANDPPGPYIPVGNTVYWRYIVQNTGNEPMTDITVMDDNGTPANPSDDFVVCSGFALDPGDHTYCYATGTAVAGQYGNIGTVMGYYNSSPYSDTDPSHYFGCSPACDITAPDAVCELSAGNSASTTAGYSSYTWALSSGTITAGQGSSSITWTAPSAARSPVNISVTVVDSNGCTNTCYKDVWVYVLPACDITAPDAVCELSAGNSASTTAGYSSYTWALSSGTITAGPGSSSITWTAPSAARSPVNISVTVVDSNGCTNTCYKDVTVYAFKPSINIIKTASLTGTCPGYDPLAVNIKDTVTYCFNVTNTGDVNLRSVTVIDDIYGSVTLGTPTLAPGESTEGTITHVVVESDANRYRSSWWHGYRYRQLHGQCHDRSGDIREQDRTSSRRNSRHRHHIHDKRHEYR
jgi:uncharacterized repeat protein (TIGR01451 family)